MDILSHTLSGFTIGATAMQFSNKGIKHKFLILIAYKFEQKSILVFTLIKIHDSSSLVVISRILICTPH